MSGPEVWDEATARWYVERYGEHATNRLAAEVAAPAAGEVALDIGCGSGAAVRAAAAQGARVIGVDPSPAMLRLAEAHTADHPTRERTTFLRGDAAHLPVADGAVDVAMAVNTLHHWDDPEAGLAEVLRALAPGGRLVIVEEEVGGRCGHGQGPWSDPDRVLERLRAAGFVDAAISRRAAGEERAILITAAGGAPPERGAW